MVQHPSVPSKGLLAQGRPRQDLWLSQRENMTCEQLSALGWSLWILSNMVPKLCSLWSTLPYQEVFLLYGILGIHSSSPFSLGLKEAEVLSTLQVLWVIGQAHRFLNQINLGLNSTPDAFLFNILGQIGQQLLSCYFFPFHFFLVFSSWCNGQSNTCFIRFQGGLHNIQQANHESGSKINICKVLVIIMGFPGGSEVKASACNVGDLGSISGSGRYPGEGNSNPPQYSCLENPMDGGA